MAEVKRQNSGVTFDLRTVPPMKEFQFRVSRFTKGISDWSGFFKAASELFKRQMGEQFETEGAAGGKPWAKNEPSYALWKATQSAKRSHKVGVLTGALRSSMTGGGGYSEHITKTRGDFGMSPSSKAAPYGEYFDYVRKVISLTPKHGRDYQKVAHTWLVAEERNAMGQGGSGLPGSIQLGGVIAKDFRS
jgi:hypothetical protein